MLTQVTRIGQHGTALRAISEIALTLLLLLAATAPSALTGEQLVRNSEHHYSLRVPEGWRPVREEVVVGFDRLIESQMPNKPFRYFAAYSKSPTGEMTYPYVLLQFSGTPLEGESAAGIQEAFGAEVTKEALDFTLKELSALVKDAQAKPKLDLANKRFVVTSSLTVPGGGRVQGISVGLLGKKGVVQLNCYDMADKFEASMPEFQQWIDSFKLDKEYEWVPGEAKGIDWGQSGRSGIIGAIAGGLIAGMLALVKWVKGRKVA